MITGADIQTAKITKVLNSEKWVHRSYELILSIADFVKLQDQMNDQDERKDNIIILKVEYNIYNSKVKISDKIRC